MGKAVGFASSPSFRSRVWRGKRELRRCKSCSCYGSGCSPGLSDHSRGQGRGPSTRPLGWAAKAPSGVRCCGAQLQRQARAYPGTPVSVLSGRRPQTDLHAFSVKAVVFGGWLGMFCRTWDAPQVEPWPSTGPQMLHDAQASVPVGPRASRCGPRGKHADFTAV